MSLYVIDASVAAKWFLPAADEPLTDEAMALLQEYVAGRVRFAVPDLFWAEFGNILWKAVRYGRCSRRSAEAAITALKARKLLTISSQTLVEQAFAIADVFRRTVYDSLYVALAVDLRAQLVTADEKLASSLAAHLPVKWLGAV